MIACIPARSFGTAYERVMARTEKQGECIVFRGALTKKGYGQVNDGGKCRMAHRVVIEKHQGVSILMVLHSCDLPACVNPDHLRYGTAAENSQDMVARDRTTRPSARLTPDDVIAVRRSELTNIELARHYGVDPSTISRVRTGDNWKKVSF